MPTGRNNAAIAYDARQRTVVVVGGYLRSLGLFADSLALRAGAGWRPLPPLPGHPLAREGMAAAYDARYGATVLFGGATAPRCRPDETPCKICDDKSLCGQPTVRLDELWALVTGPDGQLQWQDPWLDPADIPAPQDRPAARAYHAMASLGADGGVLLFGGEDANGQRLRDTWIGRWEIGPARCGNGRVDYDPTTSAFEGCDPGKHGDAPQFPPVEGIPMSCKRLGYRGGELRCSSVCIVDDSGCYY